MIEVQLLSLANGRWGQGGEESDREGSRRRERVAKTEDDKGFSDESRELTGRRDGDGERKGK